MKTRFRLPKVVPVSATQYVVVAQVTKRELADIGDLAEGERVYGLWVDEFDDNDARLGQILIDKALSQKDKWETYRHEKVHALHDIEAWLKQTGG